MDMQKCIGFINTPPLWKGEQFGIEQFDFPNVDVSLFKPEPIASKLRLGHQMEHVFKQLIKHDNTYEIIIHNLPIRANKHTLGEIDFILKNLKNKKLIHIELTYKFYIINPEISGLIHRLMGPNKKDMFFSKMEKIKNQQFKLLHSPEGIEAIAQRNIDSKQIAHQTCFKAQLFKPYKHNKNHIRPLNSDCLVGFWLYYNDFNTSEFKNHQFHIPSKSEWVIKAHKNLAWMSNFNALIEINLYMLKENAPMVWVKKSNNTIEKFFVVWW